MLAPFDEIPDALKAKPKRLDAGFAVTFSGEEATEHGDLPDNLAQRGRCFRDGFLGEDVGAFPLFVSKECLRGEVRMRAFPAAPSRPSARHYQVDRQRPFNLADAPEYPAGAARFRPCARPLLSSARFPGPGRVPSRAFFSRAHLQASVTPKGPRSGVTT